PWTGSVIDTVGEGRSLATVTLTAAAVAVLPAASRATALRECAPLVVVLVFHEMVYGAVVISAPRFAPSSLNCTPATPTLSVALAETVTEPDTVDPLIGAVIDTVGGVRSLATVTLTAAAVAVLPAASRATALRECAPLVVVLVFHEMVYGAVVISAPRLAPSSLNCTPATPTLSVALAETVTVPVTVAPLDGAVRETVGGVVSGGGAPIAVFISCW